jgi:hypothetical protein
MRPISRTVIWLALAAMAVGACGGDEGVLDPTDTRPTTPPVDESRPSDTPPPADTGGGLSPRVEGSFAFVTVGDTVYELQMDDTTGACTLRDDVMGASFALDAGGNPVEAGSVDVALQVNFVIPLPDWEARGLQPPQISLDDQATGIRWQAGGVESAGVTTEQSQLVAWTLEAGRAEGTATFLDLNSYLAGGDSLSQAGSFEIECVE